ncbi:hypothetical protein [Gordonia hongkongensis]|uniref:hypothetical protein n=1 Tax=Gordonia hongkongensis TaxID=1701090 RepID=UPI003EB927AC
MTPLGAYALGLANTFKPAEDLDEVSQLTVLPNLDIVVPRGITHTERLTLAAFATQTADHTWNVSPTTLTQPSGQGATSPSSPTTYAVAPNTNSLRRSPV